MIDAKPCGCVVTKRGGHTHAQLCAACKAAIFGETKEQFEARLAKLREELA
jgi:hypothetical protein